MKVGVIGAGIMGQGIAKAFAQVEGYTVALCDIKQEWAEGGKDKIAKGYARLVEKGKHHGTPSDGHGKGLGDGGIFHDSRLNSNQEEERQKRKNRWPQRGNTETYRKIPALRCGYGQAWRAHHMD